VRARHDHLHGSRSTMPSFFFWLFVLGPYFVLSSLHFQTRNEARDLELMKNSIVYDGIVQTLVAVCST